MRGLVALALSNVAKSLSRVDSLGKDFAFLLKVILIFWSELSLVFLLFFFIIKVSFFRFIVNIKLIPHLAR